MRRVDVRSPYQTKVSMKSPRNDPDAFIARLFPAGHAIDRSSVLSSQIYTVLREGIITMALRPDDQIYERVIADTLGVSRTPIREALQRLARDELVLIAAQSGTYVAPVRREQFVESALIRKVLETAGIRHAAAMIGQRELQELRDIHLAHRRAIEFKDAVAAIAYDNAFHAKVSAAAQLPKVLSLVELVRAPIDRVRHVTVRDPVVGDVTLRQHEAILRALEQHDPVAAEAALQAHLDDAFERQMAAFERNRAMFEGE